MAVPEQVPELEVNRSVTTGAISTRELRGRLQDPALALVDLRPQAAYNGWRLDGESRGGHIPGAVNLPAGWLGRLETGELERILASKGILPGREIVLYGQAPDLGAARTALTGLGLEPVRHYPDGLAGWARDAALPVERLVNYDKLVHPGWLQELLAGGRPEAAPPSRYVLFHVNFGVPEEYEEAHLPGAIYLDTNRLEDPADWNRRPAHELDAALREVGIDRETTIVLYGRDTEGNADEKWPGRRAGQIAAARAALILRYSGVDDVRVLDGGYDAWVRSGGALDREPHEPTPAPSFGTSIPQRPELILDIEDARRILADPAHAALVSVRTWDEHVGRSSGYNYIAPAGRIAGDVWGNCGTDAYHMQHYRTVDNTMRPYPEIAANWAEAEITPDKHVAFYCGTGWRASETWLYAYLMGWRRIGVYDGGWYEWSADPANPVETG